jgi:probable F420-dependent oxidoreductase
MSETLAPVSRRPLEFSISLQNRAVLARPETLVPMAERAEALGYDALWVTDHIVFPRRLTSRYPYSETGRFVVDPTTPYLEPLTALAYLAARTTRIRVGTSVLVAPLRHPLAAAKMLATIDVLSGGRLIVGIGAGWLADEFALLGVPFEERVARTEEYIRVFKEVWTSPEPRFEGRFVRFADIAMEPRPVQRPHPPIWIGGYGPRVLRRVVDLGDGWTPMALRPPGHFAPPVLAAEVAKLRELAAARGRDPEAITVAVKVPVRVGGTESPRPMLSGAPADIAGDLAAYRDAGARHFALDFVATDPGEMAETLARFAEEVRPIVA